MNPSKAHPDHPVIDFSILLSGYLNHDICKAVENWVLSLDQLRTWSPGHLELVHDVDMEDVNEEMEPFEVVGATLGVYSAFEPWTPTEEVSRKQLEEVQFLIREAEAFAKTHQCEMQVEYAGEQIGSICSGRVDPSVIDGLITPWEQSSST